jgi:hypothetical protein
MLQGAMWVRRRFARDSTTRLREKVALAQKQYKNQYKTYSAIAGGIAKIPSHSARVLSR